MSYATHMMILAADPMEHVLPHPLFGTHLTWFTNQSLMALIAAILMLLIFPRLFSRADASPPTGAKNFFESILEFMRIEVFRPALKEHTDRFVPFLWTVFFFILFCNLLGCIPTSEIVELVTLGHIQHIGGAATGSLSTTATLAICAFFFIHFHGIDQIAHSLIQGTYGQHNGQSPEHMRAEAMPGREMGDLGALTNPTGHYHDGEDPHDHDHAPIKAKAPLTPAVAILIAIPIYLWNFAPHPFRPGPGESPKKWWIDVPFFLFLLVLELFGALIKPFALCMRLFANMVAGHTVLAVLISLIVAVPSFWQFAVGVPLGAMHFALQGLEIFVAVLQAYIFTFLTTLFIASAVAPEH